MTSKPGNTPMADSSEPKKEDESYIQLDDKKGAASAAPVSRHRVIAGVLAAACVFLIVVSLGFVHTGYGEAWSLTWIAESLGFSSPSMASVRLGKNSSNDENPDSKDSDESGKGEEKSGDKKDSKDKGDKEDDKKNKESSDDKDDESAESSAGDDDTSSQSENGSKVVAGGSSNGGGSGNAGSSNAGQSSSSNGGSQADGLITVKVSVTSSAVGNPVSAVGTYSFQEGATAYDALCALGLSVNAHGTQYGTYVAAIGGLAEKEHGGTSGWMYSVNGVTPNTACSNYVLSNGDTVVWYYVTG